MEILKAQNISKSFGEKQVLSDVNITLNKGEIVSLLGVSGAGKTTVLNLLGGMDAVTSGEIVVDGTKVSDMNGQCLS